MSEERSIANVERIRNTMDEMVAELDGHLEMYRRYTVFLRGRIRKEKQEAEVLVQTATNVLNEMRERNEQLNAERSALRAAIGHDAQDLQVCDEERKELLAQIKELEMQGVGLEEILKERENTLNGLTKRVDGMMERSKRREDEAREKTELFRKYLGMDIVPLRENVLRIVFCGLFGEFSEECSVVLDLSSEAPVIDISPCVCDVERLNGMFKARRNFHGFLQAVRGEFRRNAT